MASVDDAQAIASLTAKFLGLPVRPEVVIGKRAEAFTDTNIITIPRDILSRHHTILTYLITHEVVHFVNGGIHHGKLFRKKEDAALKFWHITIKRGKNSPYPVEIRGK